MKHVYFVVFLISLKVTNGQPECICNDGTDACPNDSIICNNLDSNNCKCGNCPGTDSKICPMKAVGGNAKDSCICNDGSDACPKDFTFCTF